MAPMFARLRIADHISGIVARLTTGSGGLTLGRAGFAPAGRQTRFMKFSHLHSLSTRIAWSHWCTYPREPLRMRGLSQAGIASQWRRPDATSQSIMPHTGT